MSGGALGPTGGWGPPSANPALHRAAIVVLGARRGRTPDEGLDWSLVGEATQELLRQYTYAPETRRSYKSALGRFVQWCEENGVSPVRAGPTQVADYLTHLGELQPTSVARVETAAAAIACAMELAGQPYNRRDPVIVRTVRALRRKIGVAPRNQRTPLRAELVERVCEPLGSSLIDVRDRALITMGFLVGQRGINLAGICVEHLTFVAQGLDVWIPRSKSDQEGRGTTIAVPSQPDPELSPPRTVRRWLDMAGIEGGAVFRAVDRWGNLGGPLTRQEVSRTLKKLCVRAGIDPETFGSHSLRSGFSTSARENGASMDRIRDQTGHESDRSLLRYIRHADRYRDNAAAALLKGKTRQ
jgi:integrase